MLTTSPSVDADQHKRPFGSGGGQPRERPVVSGALCGDVDLDLGRAASVGEAWVPAAEAAG